MSFSSIASPRSSLTTLFATDSFQSPTDLFFVIDYKSGGELFTHLQRDGGRFEENKVQFYIAEIVLALDFLHSANVIYR